MRVFEFDGFGFKFGMYASAISEKAAGCSIAKLFHRLTEDGEATMAMLQYFYGAACAYNESKGKPRPTLDEVSDWLEKLGIEKAGEVLNESVGLPKNSEAPKETGPNTELPTS